MGLCSCGEAGKYHLIQGTEDFKKTEAGPLGGAFSSVHEGKTTHYIIVCMRQGHPDCLLGPRWFPKDSRRKGELEIEGHSFKCLQFCMICTLCFT